jgi:hypothetical protein
VRATGFLARLLLFAATAARADEPAFVSLGGLGLLTVPDTRTLPRGRVFAGFTLDNRDRDPLGIDLLDAGLAVHVGLTPRAELQAHVVLSRVVSLPEPPLVAPPLDLVVAPGAAAPARPYYAIQWAAPYVDKSGTARFDAWVPGDVTIGGLVRLWDATPSRPALAARFAISVPASLRPRALRSGSGTGGTDVALSAVGGWSRGGFDVLAVAGYRRRGRGTLGDRLIVADLANPPAIHDEALDVPDRIEAGVGGRRRFGNGRAALVTEARGAWSVGARTATLDDRRDLDLLGGIQLRLGAARLTAGLRYHAGALPSGAPRATPLVGAVDVTALSDAALASYLGAVGPASVAAALRPGAQHVVVGGTLPPPAGAHVIPATYVVRSEHQIGLVAVLGWIF